MWNRIADWWNQILARDEAVNENVDSQFPAGGITDDWDTVSTEGHWEE